MALEGVVAVDAVVGAGRLVVGDGWGDGHGIPEDTPGSIKTKGIGESRGVGRTVRVSLGSVSARFLLGLSNKIVTTRFRV